MSVENKNIEQFKFMYETNMKMALEFWEWRHKVLTRYFLSMGSIFVFAGWLYKDSPELYSYLPIPLMIGALLSFFFLQLDIRNDKILKECYTIGAGLEKQYANDNCIFSKLLEFKNNNNSTYHSWLRILYAASTVILLISSLTFAYHWPILLTCFA